MTQSTRLTQLNLKSSVLCVCAEPKKKGFVHGISRIFGGGRKDKGEKAEKKTGEVEGAATQVEARH